MQFTNSPVHVAKRLSVVSRYPDIKTAMIVDVVIKQCSHEYKHLGYLKVWLRYQTSRSFR